MRRGESLLVELIGSEQVSGFTPDLADFLADRAQVRLVTLDYGFQRGRTLRRQSFKIGGENALEPCSLVTEMPSRRCHGPDHEQIEREGQDERDPHPARRSPFDNIRRALRLAHKKSSSSAAGS